MEIRNLCVGAQSITIRKQKIGEWRGRYQKVQNKLLNKNTWKQKIVDNEQMTEAARCSFQKKRLKADFVDRN